MGQRHSNLSHSDTHIVLTPILLPQVLPCTLTPVSSSSLEYSPGCDFTTIYIYFLSLHSNLSVTFHLPEVCWNPSISGTSSSFVFTMSLLFLLLLNSLLVRPQARWKACLILVHNSYHNSLILCENVSHKCVTLTNVSIISPNLLLYFLLAVPSRRSAPLLISGIPVSPSVCSVLLVF